MREIYEFRVREKYANRLFDPDEGEKLGWTKQYPKFKRVGELNVLIRKDPNDFFFAGWNISRRYTASDIAQAKLFLLCRLATFEPAGEECGTQYDELSACPDCKSGAKQISPLFLDWKRIPKNKDIARTIAGEIVVSKRMIELFERYSITGARFGPVCQHPAQTGRDRVSRPDLGHVVSGRRHDYPDRHHSH